MKACIVLLLVCTFAQAQTSPNFKPMQLVGRKVTVGRLPLCQPGTYNTDLSHSGKVATVISGKPNSLMPKLAPSILNRMPPENRNLVLEQMDAATLVLQFEDGTKLDTCAPLTANRAADGLELLPGQELPTQQPTPSTVTPAVSAASTQQNPLAASSPTASPGNAMLPTNSAVVKLASSCPVVITKVSSSDGGFGHALADAMTTSEFERQLDKTMAGGKSKHYLDMRMKNNTNSAIRAVESGVIYTNVMGDPQATDTLVTQNTKPIKPGQEFKSYFMDRSLQSANGRGEVTVYVNRVRFADGTFWNDDGSQACKLTSQIK